MNPDILGERGGELNIPCPPSSNAVIAPSSILKYLHICFFINIEEIFKRVCCLWNIPFYHQAADMPAKLLLGFADLPTALLNVPTYIDWSLHIV